MTVVCNFDDDTTTEDEETTKSQSPSSPSSSSFVKPHNKTVETLKNNGEYRKEELKNFSLSENELAIDPSSSASSLSTPVRISNNGRGGISDSEETLGANAKSIRKSSSKPIGINGSSHAGSENRLKPTLSQAMMNSNLLNSLPKYIFQSDHEQLTSVNKYIQDLKDQHGNDSSADLNSADLNSACEVSEYPIEFIENQAHVINRHISKFVLFFIHFLLIYFI